MVSALELLIPNFTNPIVIIGIIALVLGVLAFMSGIQFFRKPALFVMIFAGALIYLVSIIEDLLEDAFVRTAVMGAVIVVIAGLVIFLTGDN